MSAALSIFDRNLFYLKNTVVVEQLARINTLVMDKTGTITHGSSQHIDLDVRLSPEHRQLIQRLRQFKPPAEPHDLPVFRRHG